MTKNLRLNPIAGKRIVRKQIMRPEDIRELKDAQPFLPFRICLADGKSYDVPHRDFVMIAKTVIDIGIARNAGSGIYDQIVRISPLHIVRIKNLQAA